MNQQGLFIAFEGGEGSGKTTQTMRLVEWLCARGHRVLRTREPGGTGIGTAIRDLLINKDPHHDIPPTCEALLYAADRAAHVETVLRPALAEGKVVVTDRYVDSSIAYQGVGRELGPFIIELALWATSYLNPDLTIVLDIDPAEGLARAGTRGLLDRLEREPMAFHQEVRAAFLKIAETAPAGRYLVLDATRTAGELAADIRARVAELLPAPVEV